MFSRIFIIIALFTAINPMRSSAADTKNVSVITSFYPVYIMTINVCKDVPGITVTNLTPPITGCPHDYLITTNDMRKLAGADIFIANGAGIESFLGQVVKKYPHMKAAALSDGIPLIKGTGGRADNPHLWVSVSDYMLEVENLKSAMEAFDPAHKDLYNKNAGAYIAKLEALKTRMYSELAPFRGKKIITFHEAFEYFAREFGLEIAAIIEREPGSEPGAKELAETVDLIKKNGIKCIFSEPQYPASAAELIAKETGAQVYALDPAVTGPDDPDAYIKIMEKNLSVLKKALS